MTVLLSPLNGSGDPFILDALSSASSGDRCTVRSRATHRTGIGTWYRSASSDARSVLVAAASSGHVPRPLSMSAYFGTHSATPPKPQPATFLTTYPRGVLPPFRAGEFDPLDLADRKAAQGLSLSVCLPARNEEATIGHIVGTVRRDLMARIGLVDEIVVLDDGSTDATAAAAREAGARVVTECSVLAGSEPGSGKGNALWKSLYACEGDLVCWVDADIRNFGSHFVTGLVGPLIDHGDIGFVKGFYDRPLHGEPGGGRVTELVARPLLSQLFPALTAIVQPLAGEYAGRREVLDAVPFVAEAGRRSPRRLVAVRHGGACFTRCRGRGARPRPRLPRRAGPPGRTPHLRSRHGR